MSLDVTDLYFIFISITQERNTIDCCGAHMNNKEALQADIIVRKVIY